MKVTIYKDGVPVGEKEIPDEIVKMVVALDRWMEMNECTQLHGIGPVLSLQRQLVEVTAERDRLKLALELADALRNNERGVPKC